MTVREKRVRIWVLEKTMFLFISLWYFSSVLFFAVSKNCGCFCVYEYLIQICKISVLIRREINRNKPLFWLQFFSHAYILSSDNSNQIQRWKSTTGSCWNTFLLFILNPIEKCSFFANIFAKLRNSDRYYRTTMPIHRTERNQSTVLSRCAGTWRISAWLGIFWKSGIVEIIVTATRKERMTFGWKELADLPKRRSYKAAGVLDTGRSLSPGLLGQGM